VACAVVLWEAPGRDWLPRAAALVPSGAAGASVRAAAALHGLFTTRSDDTERAALLGRYQKELARMELGADDRRALALLGEIGATGQPTPESRRAQQLIAELDEHAPCEPANFPLRALAVRGDPDALARFAGAVVRRCSEVPGGAAAAVDAIGVLLSLAHEDPQAARPEVVDELALALARAHPDDPAAVGAHADAVALQALAQHAPRFALEAALARYEEAIAHATPAGGGSARARLESNAAALSLLLARQTADKTKQAALWARTMHHLRFALALEESAAVLANRAAFDAETHLRMGESPPSLSRLAPGRNRARAACLYARAANAAGEHALASLVEMAHEGQSGELRFDAEELLVETAASFNVALEARALRPAAEMKTGLYLAPACDPDEVTRSRPAAKKSSTPAPRTESKR
jgi:hypothetical protein